MTRVRASKLTDDVLLERISAEALWRRRILSGVQK